MSDIDFDELDRAVNSLISNDPGSATAKADVNTAMPASDNPNPAIVPQPVVAPQPVVEKPTLTPVSQSLAGQRSSGRFMDVIHPSSDMRSASTSNVQVVQPVAAPIPAPQIVPSPVFDQNIAPNAPKPLESPFIAGAVVQKRPLGTFATESEQSIELSPSGEVTEKPVDCPAPAEPVDKAAIEEPIADSVMELPDELKSDILKVESGNAVQTTNVEQKSELEPEPVLVADPVQSTFQSESIAPTSIVQQYKEQPADNTERTGSMFDTNVYHKSPKPIEKKGSGWMWILWIIILLVVGVGAGAVTYFYVLPLL